ncbi:reverse transcriptase-like protein [Tetragenococcus halophilus]|uniref:reverse transcriptase-like protein n=1 Tax=Tetragenococcus halophilus TaxID=51669 RepID=UPI00301060E5
MSDKREFIKKGLVLAYKDEKEKGKSNVSSVREWLESYDFLTKEEYQTILDEMLLIDSVYGAYNLEVYMDGSCINNPFSTELQKDRVIGAGGAFIIRDTEGKEVLNKSFKLPTIYSVDGETLSTNCHACEFQTLQILLQTLAYSSVNMKEINLKVYTDSVNLYSQIEDNHHTKQPIHLQLKKEIMKYIYQLNNFELVKIPRRENQMADAMAKECAYL